MLHVLTFLLRRFQTARGGCQACRYLWPGWLLPRTDGATAGPALPDPAGSGTALATLPHAPCGGGDGFGQAPLARVGLRMVGLEVARNSERRRKRGCARAGGNTAGCFFRWRPENSLSAVLHSGAEDPPHLRGRPHLGRILRLVQVFYEQRESAFVVDFNSFHSRIHQGRQMIRRVHVLGPQRFWRGLPGATRFFRCALVPITRIFSKHVNNVLVPT